MPPPNITPNSNVTAQQVAENTTPTPVQSLPQQPTRNPNHATDEQVMKHGLIAIQSYSSDRDRNGKPIAGTSKFNSYQDFLMAATDKTGENPLMPLANKILKAVDEEIRSSSSQAIDLMGAIKIAQAQSSPSQPSPSTVPANSENKPQENSANPWHIEQRNGTTVLNLPLIIEEQIDSLPADKRKLYLDALKESGSGLRLVYENNTLNLNVVDTTVVDTTIASQPMPAKEALALSNQLKASPANVLSLSNGAAIVLLKKPLTNFEVVEKKLENQKPSSNPRDTTSLAT